jgi:hypothetical protein
MERCACGADGGTKERAGEKCVVIISGLIGIRSLVNSAPGPFVIGKPKAQAIKIQLETVGHSPSRSRP